MTLKSWRAVSDRGKSQRSVSFGNLTRSSSGIKHKSNTYEESDSEGDWEEEKYQRSKTRRRPRDPIASLSVSGIPKAKSKLIPPDFLSSLARSKRSTEENSDIPRLSRRDRKSRNRSLDDSFLRELHDNPRCVMKL